MTDVTEHLLVPGMTRRPTSVWLLCVLLAGCAGAPQSGNLPASGPAEAATQTTLAELCKAPPETHKAPAQAASLATMCNPRVLAKAGDSKVTSTAGRHAVTFSKPMTADDLCEKGKPKTGVCIALQPGDSITGTQF